DFRAGIGIATGRAVAGKIGTSDHVKVTVFGPGVNLAARLGTMKKFWNTSILVDPNTAAILRRQLRSELGRVRRVAVVRPYGLDSSVEVSELLPPESAYPELTDQNLRDYERALESFLKGQWQEALD